MAKILPITDFVDWLAKQADTDNDGKAKAGYIMGMTGAVLTDKLLKQYSTYQTGYSPATYIDLGQKWMGRRCFDCNGLAEGYYLEMTGVSINTKARYNYRDWCHQKGTDMSAMPQMPGVAVFSPYPKTAETISHVGYLWRYRDGDWDVIEARGVKYGVVVTRLKARSWAAWGVMDKYFDYGEYGEAAQAGTVRVTGNRVNVRSGPGTGYGIIDCVDKGTAYPDGNPDGWRAVMIGGKLGWVSPKYSEVVN